MYCTYSEPPFDPWSGNVDLSVDGSFSDSDGTAVAAMILRAETGKILFAAYRYIFHCNDSLEAEIHALIQRMALAIQHTALPVVVQSDIGLV